MNIKGTVKRIEPINNVTDSFKKQELILSVQDGQYEQTICVEFQQDNCSKLDSFAPGQEVDVQINLRGREWTNPKPKKGQNPVRVFNTIVGWKIETVGAEQTPSAEEMSDDSDDDLPF